MLQNLMSPLALSQPGLDPFSVGSVSSMSSPTTTLSPGNIYILIFKLILYLFYNNYIFIFFRYIWCGCQL